jgi:hypothetical protein
LNQIILPDLLQTLHDSDFGYLQIVAETWDIELNAPDIRAGLPILIQQLKDPRCLEGVISNLSKETQAAFQDLIQSGGQMSWSLFVRKYGLLREMGPGRRDREQPHVYPVSITETLWYRALIGRRFFDTPSGPQEYAFIPQEFLAAIGNYTPLEQGVIGRLATQRESKVIFPADDRILDDACSLLAALRTGEPRDRFISVKSASNVPTDVYLNFLSDLLRSARVIDQNATPLTEPTRAFLEAGRGEALRMLVQSWQQSAIVNELRLLPGLIFEGDWQNESLRTRRLILDDLSKAPGQPGLPTIPASESVVERSYVYLESFVEDVYKLDPDFQRPAGDYDSWFIKSASSGEYLRGFEHWSQVDGAYLRFIITGPLHWLGLIDLAGHADDVALPGPVVCAFRFSKMAQALLAGVSPVNLLVEDGKCQVYSDGRIIIPRTCPRVGRYQITRFCNWEKFNDDAYYCRLSPASINRAIGQGLRISHLIALLRKYSPTIPPSLERALDNYQAKGQEVHIDQVIVLRVKRPEILQALRKTRAARFLVDPLGSTAVVLQPGSITKVLQQLAELGYLGEVDFDQENREHSGV